MKKNKVGIILLAVWLIISGLVPLFNLHVVHLDIVLALLAIAAGVLLLLDK